MINAGRSRRYLFLLLIAAALEFLCRGPVRTLRYGEFTDLSVPYVAARLWLARANPYDHNLFMSTWTGEGGRRFVARGSPTNLRPAYPPSTLPVLSLFAFLPWIAARDLVLCVSVVLFVFLLRALLRLGSLRLNSTPGMLCCAWALALAPWHGAIAWQNPSSLTMELALIGISLESAVGGGLMMGVALCLKPQLTAWFILSDLVQKRWRRALWCLGLFAVVTALALGRLPHGWLDSYRENLRYFFAIGDVNDFTTRNPSRFELLSLQVIFYYVTRLYRLSDVLSGLVTACLLLWWYLRVRCRPELVNLAAVVLIGLLPVYQRIYNAGLIVLVLPYALAHWRERKAQVLLAASSVFLVPGTAILQILHARHWIGEVTWNRSWLLNLFVGPQATWAVITIIITLLLWHKTAARPVPVAHEPANALTGDTL